MTIHRLFQVDSFTDAPFKGNPAGVCIPSYGVTVEWMQSIAREMNLSETAFVIKKPTAFDIRFFTPETEVPLCGHATLAAAHILYETGTVKPTDKIKFKSKSGNLIASQRDDWIEMDFPKDSIEKIGIPEVLRKIVDTEIKEAYRSGFGWYMLELNDEDAVEYVKPNFHIMRSESIGPLIVTAKSEDPRYDFVSRFFAPTIGIDEDPVTGSAHCVLGPFWAEKLAKRDLIGHQISRRQGTIGVYVDDSRVILSGKAVTIFGIDLKV
jgi:PhzF family phenazine biosynthesis protein